MQENKYVWYVCYGSNLAIERLYCYFNGQSNEKVHIKRGFYCPFCPNPNFESRLFEINHPVYFANRAGTSSNWGNTGVAFLDVDNEGFAYGRAYKMPIECFEHLHKCEGTGPNWYNKIVSLGYMEDGCEILTFTNKEKLEELMPCDDYMKVIKKGLLELDVDVDEACKYILKLVRKFGITTEHIHGWNHDYSLKKRINLIIESPRLGFWRICGKEKQKHYRYLTRESSSGTVDYQILLDEIVSVYEKTVDDMPNMSKDERKVKLKNLRRLYEGKF